MPWRGRIVAWSGALLVINALVTLGLLQVLLGQAQEEAIKEEFDTLRIELDQAALTAPPTTTLPLLLEDFLRTHLNGRDELLLSLVDGVPNRRVAAESANLPRLDLDPDLVALWASQDSAQEGTAVATDATGGTEPIRWLAVPVRQGDQSGHLVAAIFTERRAESTNRAVQIAALIQMAVGVVLLGLLGDRLALGLATPLAQLTERTRDIRETGIDDELPVIGDDEVARLAETINALLSDTRNELATRRRLIADAGHELRTPITIVRGHLELLPDAPDERDETLALVDDELERMSGLVNDLLALATADQPGFVRPEPVDLGDLGRRLLATVEPLAGDRVWKLEADEVPALLDEKRIRQAVVALVDNAVRHTEPGGVITLRLRRPLPSLVAIAVADDGPGVPPDVAEVAFAPFRHGHGTRRGTGLGLALVAAIATGHDGRADLTTSVGGGTTVTLTIPQATEDEA